MRVTSSQCSHDMHVDARQRLPLVTDREAFLVDLCSSYKRVAHIGCVDAPYTRARLAAGDLLHRRLLDKAEVVGFDIDEGSLQLLQSHLPAGKFVCADISREVPAEHAERYDLVIAGEVLEHVGDGHMFLTGCKRLMSKNGRLCVTVPNACSPKIGLRAAIGRESVHPDHFVYYGPRTLRRTLAMAGFKVEMMATYFAVQTGPLGRAANLALRLSHRCFSGPVGEGLIAVAHL